VFFFKRFSQKGAKRFDKTWLSDILRLKRVFQQSLCERWTTTRNNLNCLCLISVHCLEMVELKWLWDYRRFRFSFSRLWRGQENNLRYLERQSGPGLMFLADRSLLGQQSVNYFIATGFAIVAKLLFLWQTIMLWQH